MPEPCYRKTTQQPIKKTTKQTQHHSATNTSEPRHCHCHHHDTMNLLQPPPLLITHPYHHRNSPPSWISNMEKPTAHPPQPTKQPQPPPPSITHHHHHHISHNPNHTLWGSFFGQYLGPSRNKNPRPFTGCLVDWAWFIAAKWGLITNQVVRKSHKSPQGTNAIPPKQ